MFMKNEQHLQPALISSVTYLPEKQRQRLANSWAEDFYTDVFSRINEEAFAVLYVDFPSRPNVPVNILTGLEVLKAGFGWSDEELYNEYTFNVLVRYALGIHELGKSDFEIRSLYNFRQRLSHYNQAHGVNLMEQAFEDITDQQIEALEIKTGKQRMDSTQVASNIVDASRLQLLVEALQRLWRILREADQEQYHDRLAGYISGGSGRYVYRVKGQEATQEHLQKIGQLVYALLGELEATYGQEAAYQVLERFFHENFYCTVDHVKPKENDEISAGCLQSVDDLEATYRKKGNKEYKGYVANLTETCDPDNPLQLITKVQVAPNNTEDSDLLVEAVPDLKDRTDLDTLLTDGVYASPKTDETLYEQKVTHIQSAIRGCKPNEDRLALADFDIQQNEDGRPTQITCPHGQTVAVQQGRKDTTFWADFDPAVCQSCPFQKEGQCRTKLGKRNQRFRLRFNYREMQVAIRRRVSAAFFQSGQNLRAAVEASVRSLKHPFPASKLPVRGLFRMSYVLVASAAMVNLRRIHRHRIAKEEHASDQKTNPNQPQPSIALFFSTYREYFCSSIRRFGVRQTCFSF